jgi:hypothetical protein
VRGKAPRCLGAVQPPQAAVYAPACGGLELRLVDHKKAPLRGALDSKTYEGETVIAGDPLACHSS